MGEPKYLKPCPECGRPLSVPGGWFGQRGKCPWCGAVFLLGAATIGPPVSPAPAGPTEPLAWDDDDLPWERPGALRRDCEGDRGRDLKWLGTAGLLLGMGSLCCPLVAVAALGVGLMACRMTGRDLQMMDSGRMDPAGRSQTLDGRTYALGALVLGALSLGLYTVPLVIAVALWAAH
jgi:hypothetical protein